MVVNLYLYTDVMISMGYWRDLILQKTTTFAWEAIVYVNAERRHINRRQTRDLREVEEEKGEGRRVIH